MIVVCLGSGPSLTPADVDACRGHALVIAINDTYRLAPWAYALYAADAQWWRWHEAVPATALPYMKYTLQPEARQWRPDVRLLAHTGRTGIDWRPGKVRTGGHGGYQAINLAAHFAPSTIVLLGYDMQPAADNGRHHFFGEHPNGNHPRYAERLRAYDGLVDTLAERGIRLVNASRETAITQIPRVVLADVLS